MSKLKVVPCYNGNCRWHTTLNCCWVAILCLEHSPFPDYYRLEGQRFLRERWGEFNDESTTSQRVTGVEKSSTQRFYVSDRAMKALKQVQQYKHGSTLSNPHRFIVNIYINGELRCFELKAFDAINAIRILCRVYGVATSAVVSVFKSKQF